MNRAALIAVLLAGCQPEPKDFPPLGGGGGGPGGGAGGGNNDAGIDALQNPLSGRVCLVSDLRKLDECAATGADGLTVTLGSYETQTEVDGSFIIEGSQGTSVAWKITGTNIVSSVQGLSIVHQIPAIRTSRYADLLLDNGIILNPGQGSIVVEVLESNAPKPNALATTNPVASFGTRYDGSSALVWDQDQTGVFGIAWISGIASGATLLTIASSTLPDVDTTVTIEDGAITFVRVAI